MKAWGEEKQNNGENNNEEICNDENINMKKIEIYIYEENINQWRRKKAKKTKIEIWSRKYWNSEQIMSK